MWRLLSTLDSFECEDEDGFADDVGAGGWVCGAEVVGEEEGEGFRME